MVAGLQNQRHEAVPTPVCSQCSCKAFGRFPRPFTCTCKACSQGQSSAAACPGASLACKGVSRSVAMMGLVPMLAYVVRWSTEAVC